MWDEIKGWMREKALGLARTFPEIGETVLRHTLGDDPVNMVYFLYKETPGLDTQIADAKKDPIFKAVYEGTEGNLGVYALAQRQIQSKIDALPQEWLDAAAKAGIPKDALIARMKENGAEKVAFSIASSVQEELHSDTYYAGHAVRDIWKETTQKTWKELPDFFGDPLGWIAALWNNISGLFTGLFTGHGLQDVKERGMKYVVADADARAGEVVNTIGRKLVNMGMPASFAADTMLTAFTAIKQAHNPKFQLSSKEEAARKGQFLADMNAVAAPHTQTAQAKAPAAPTEKGFFKSVEEYATSSGDSKPEFDYPEFGGADLSKYIKNKGWSDNALTNGMAMTVGLILAGDEARQREIIKSYIPEAEFSYDTKGSMIIGIGKEKYYWNRDGMSVQDLAAPAMWAAKWAPMGKLTGLLTAGKGFLMKTLAWFGVGAGWSAATDGTASLIAGKPDVDVGQALINSGFLATFPAFAAVPVGKLGALARKLLDKKPLDTGEEAAMQAAGVEIDSVRVGIVNVFKEHPIAATLAAAGGTMLPVAAAAGEAVPSADLPSGSTVSAPPYMVTGNRVPAHAVP